MKLKVLQTLLMLSKYFVYGLTVQILLINMMWAESTHAQKAVSVKEVEISISNGTTNVKSLFKEVESLTEFNIHYDKDEIKDKLKMQVDISNPSELVVSDVLIEISKQAGIKFRQVNKDISAVNIDKQDAVSSDMLTVELYEKVEVTGTIRDEQGELLPGVSLLVKGKNTGTVTDFDGNYKLQTNANDVIIVSYVGFETVEIDVANRTTIDIILISDVKQLAEVVVVGYGQQQKSDVTGVVTAVQAKDFNKGAVVSADNLIAGKVAGVLITSNSGEPGGQSSVRIRGGTSLTASNEPLYVIDGLPIDNSALNPTGFQVGRNPLNSINPNDIENVTVLKDASAAAIYGSRAANGVIIITTKKGKKGSPVTIDYSAWTSIATPTKQIDVLSADQMRNEVQTFAGTLVNGSAIDRTSELGTANTNWQDEIFQTAIGQSHNIGVSGSGENSTYRFSAGYLDQEGVIKTSTTERLNLAMSFATSAISNQLDISGNLKTSYTKDRFTQSGAIGNALIFDPTQEVFDESSPYGGYFEYANNVAPSNPLAILNLTQDRAESFRTLGNIDFKYSFPFLEGLSAKVNIGFDSQTGDRDFFQPQILRSEAGSNNGTIRYAGHKRTNLLLETTLDYQIELENIQSRINVTGGYSHQDFNNRFPGYVGTNLNTDALGSANPAVANALTISNNRLSNRLISFFGRINYNLKDKYMLTATMRRDGSSRFSDASRWGVFPSVAVAWRASEEDFIKSLSFVSDLKLRVGWGVNGNQEIPDYLFLPLFVPGDANAQPQLGNKFVTTFRPNGFDPNLKWEETESYNVGLDFGFFGGRLSGSLEYYKKKTKDLLFQIAVPAGSNLSNRVTTNIGSIENQGLELSLNSYLINSDKLSWNIGFNLAFNNNKIAKVNGNSDDGFLGIQTGNIQGGTGNQIQILRVGEAVNSFFVYEHKRDENGDPVKDVLGSSTNLLDLYVDQDNNGVIDNNDRLPYKNPAPKAIIGLTSNLEYRQFDLTFTLRANIGNHVYNNVLSNYSSLSGVRINNANSHLSNVLERSLELGFSNQQLFSDVFVEDASFIRMDNITLGYSFNQLKNLKLRVYGTVQNLFLITGYSGLDPEIGNSTNNAVNPTYGIDNNVFPRAKTFIFGLNLGF